MAEDFQLGDETKRLIEHTLAKRPTHAGTPDDPYDLRNPAAVIVPVMTPLVNALPNVPYVSDTCECLCAQVTRAKSTLAKTYGDGQARTFAELLFALKCIEQTWVTHHISTWAIAHGVADQPLYHPLLGGQNLSVEDTHTLARQVRIGVAQDYVGWTEDLGDVMRFTVSRSIAVLIDEPVAPVAA